MKFSKVLVLIMVIVMLMSLTACDSSDFLSDKKVASLVEEYGTPTMDVVLEFTLDEDSDGVDEVYTITLSYELQLETTPITVVNFINLVEAGYYDQTATTTDDVTATTSHFFGTGFSSTNALLAGKYTITQSSDEDSDDTFSLAESLDYSILGEFVSNEYVIEVDEDEEDEDITDYNNTVELFSLAMYHGATASTFDDAAGQFILTTSSDNTVNYQNYAVFAYLVNMKVEVDGVLESDGGINSAILETIVEELDTTSTEDVVYIDDSDVEQTDSVSLYTEGLSIVSISMTDGNDYSLLPTYVIED